MDAVPPNHAAPLGHSMLRTCVYSRYAFMAAQLPQWLSSASVVLDRAKP